MSKKSCKQGLEILSKRLGEKYEEKYKHRVGQLPIVKSTRDSAAAKKEELEKKIAEMQNELKVTNKALEEAEKEIDEVAHDKLIQCKDWIDFLLSVHEKIDSRKQFVINCRGKYWDIGNYGGSIRALADLQMFPSFKNTNLFIRYGFNAIEKPGEKMVTDNRRAACQDIVTFDPPSKKFDHGGIVMIN